ncbi:MAG: hypothetical protein OXC91_10505, partial [Rhodobacteraceae bacterium]|nr:hypothetical protein [Paracoccaceae bacterium]
MISGHRARITGFAGHACGSLLLYLLIAAVGPAGPAQADGVTSGLEIMTDESPRSGVWFAAKTMALQYQAITDRPVQLAHHGAEGSALDSFLEREPDGSVLLLTHDHLIRMLTGPDNEALDDIDLLARGINIPQVLATRCDRFLNAVEILSVTNRDMIRFGAVEGLLIDALAARALWSRVHGLEPDLQMVADQDQLADAINDGSIDVAITGLAETTNRNPSDALCPRPLPA